MATAADKGKWAEKQVHDFLTDYSSRRADFDFERLPDARAAMGRFKAMIADFEFFLPGAHGVIEVKEVSKGTRIAKDKIKQLPRLHLRAMCGGCCIVLIHQAEKRLWRVALAPQMPLGQASWDFSSWPAYASVAEALKQYQEFA